jgi:hypothetical protein
VTKESRNRDVVATVEEAAAWVDRVGIALLFPKDDVVLPSLWQAAGGADVYSERGPDGTFIGWVPPMDFVWRAKDELPARGLACAGKHVRGRASLVSLRLLPALVALARRDDLDRLEADIVELLHADGPLSTRELPDLLPGHERKRVRAALDRLQKRLIVTNAGLESTEGWAATVVDLVDRRYEETLREQPTDNEARATIARCILETTGELTAEDLRGATGWRKRDCEDALERTGAASRTEDAFTIWTAPNAA